jgi:hypothetical protein
MIPVHDRLSVALGGYLGTASGTGLPEYRRFLVGGVLPSAVFAATQPGLLGLSAQERDGTVARIGRVGLQWEVRNERFVTLRLDVGGVAEGWTASQGGTEVGWGVSLGATSIVGPIALGLDGGASHGARLSVGVGRTF